MIRVAIADDQPLLRATLTMLVGTADDMLAVGETATGAQVVELAVRTRPDVVLMDIRMPDVDGLEATRRIRADPSLSDVHVIILTTFDLDEYVYAALRAGAGGFLLKDIPPADLLAAIRVVASGEALLAPTVTRRLIAEFTRAAAAAPLLARDLATVTGREREVLALVARGLTNSEIAAHLGLGVATVKTHVRRLLSKLDVHDRAQLVIIAYESGLVTAAKRSG
ncbi:response regulator transcription factor [Nonomuraea fuscirosea]|uniref:response regulator transcription factor n=1 Tax=Nonomuraea fuscirosea TaxID=1291556 RepID=UPI002DDB2A98|nr:response regulator transcription factor [Nonomuraea fuscirosea]WSA56813.1 response regulator transcription factor [Nonomuraea fuscirosea]